MNTDINKTDLELVAEVLEGNKKSFSEIVKRYQKPLMRLTMRFIKDLDQAQDVVQEALIKAYEKLNTFEGRASFKSWLFQITVNTAKNKLREARDFSDIQDVKLGVSPTAEKGLISRAVAKIVAQEVEKLPFKQKTALVLRVYEDLSFAEIAEIMECPYDTAKANYRHALMKLRHSFENEQELRNWSDESQSCLAEFQMAAEEA